VLAPELSRRDQSAGDDSRDINKNNNDFGDAVITMDKVTQIPWLKNLCASRLLRFMTLLLLLAAGLCSFADDDTKQGGTLYVVSEQWPGYSNADGSGLYFELIKAVFEPEGIAVNIRIHPILRGIASIHSGEHADVMLADWGRPHLAKSPQYDLQRIIFPQYPIFVEYVEALFQPGSTLSWAEIKADKSKRLAWIRGYNYDIHLDLTEHSLVMLNKGEQGFKMLLSGNIDSFLHDRSDLRSLEQTEAAQAVVWRKELVAARKLYPLFHNSPRGQQFSELYDRRMAAMLKSGELAALYQRFGEDYSAVLAIKE
tara:strand:+ start:2974 stop:3909 length:936 start_codon:yes stop_codon:yes gene_type:complete